LAHPSNEITGLMIDPRAATTLARLPAPIGPKAASMPADHGLGLDHRDRTQNRGEQSVHPNQDQPIDVPEPHPRPSLAAQYYHLLTQDKVFGLESRARCQFGSRHEQKLDQKLDHRAFEYHSPTGPSPRIKFSVRQESGASTIKIPSASVESWQIG